MSRLLEVPSPLVLVTGFINRTEDVAEELLSAFIFLGENLDDEVDELDTVLEIIAVSLDGLSKLCFGHSVALLYEYSRLIRLGLSEAGNMLYTLALFEGP